MRVLFSCNPLLGHLYPMLPLASSMRALGHEVAFATGSDVAATLSREGFEVLESGPTFDEMVGMALTKYPDTSLETPADQQRFGLERLFSEIRVATTRADVESHADAFAPDVVVNDAADFVGPLVAARRHIPNATVGIGLVVADHWLPLAAAGVAAEWRSAGLDPPADAGLYRSLYINQLPRSLQRSSVDLLPAVQDLRPVVVGAGTSLPADLEHLGRDRPLVYVTFGTVFGDPDVVNRVVTAIRPLDVDLLVTVGPDADPTAVDQDERVVVRAFVPQGAVLDRCRVAVTHGGVGSLVGPLSYGVPVVVIPMGADQQENADQAAAANAARVVALDALDTDAVARAVADLIADPEAAATARSIRDEISAMPGPDVVAEVVAALG